MVSRVILEADLRLALGEPEQARAMLEALDDVPETAIGLRAWSWRSGDPAAAAATIARFRTDEQSTLRPYANVEAWLVDALATTSCTTTSVRRARSSGALDAAEPRGLRHPFFGSARASTRWSGDIPAARPGTARSSPSCWPRWPPASRTACRVRDPCSNRSANAS